MSKPEKTVTPEARAIADALKAALTTVDTSVENEQTRSTDTDVFIDTLPEGLTPEHVDKLKTHKTNFAAGGVTAISELGLAASVETGNTKLVTRARLKMGKGEHLDITYTPIKEGTLPARTEGGEPTPYKTYGSVVVGNRSVLDSKGGNVGIALDLAKSASEAALSKLAK